MFPSSGLLPICKLLLLLLLRTTQGGARLTCKFGHPGVAKLGRAGCNLGHLPLAPLAPPGGGAPVLYCCYFHCYSYSYSYYYCFFFYNSGTASATATVTTTAAAASAAAAAAAAVTLPVLIQGRAEKPHM